MLDKTAFPEREPAPRTDKRGKRRAARRAEWDPLAEAFRDHGIDPSEPDAEKRLLLMMARRFYPKPWRPRDEGWRAQFISDVIDVIGDHGCGLSQERIAELLKERHPERYGTAAATWLRQRVSISYKASPEEIWRALELVNAEKAAGLKAADDARRRSIEQDFKQLEERLKQRGMKGLALWAKLDQHFLRHYCVDPEERKRQWKIVLEQHPPELPGPQPNEALHELERRLKLDNEHGRNILRQRLAELREPIPSRPA